eukprot:9282354-Pyramimonas_sp.AAC.1
MPAEETAGIPPAVSFSRKAGNRSRVSSMSLRISCILFFGTLSRSTGAPPPSKSCTRHRKNDGRNLRA